MRARRGAERAIGLPRHASKRADAVGEVEPARGVREREHAVAVVAVAVGVVKVNYHQVAVAAARQPGDAVVARVHAEAGEGAAVDDSGEQQGEGGSHIFGLRAGVAVLPGLRLSEIGKL